MFKAYEILTYEQQIDPATLSNEQLVQAHEALMECPINSSYWLDLDSELCYRCEEEESMEWPY